MSLLYLGVRAAPGDAAFTARIVAIHHVALHHAIGAKAHGDRGGAPGESINAW